MNNKEISDRVPDVIQSWLDTYKNKNSNYGAAWLLTGQTLALWFPQGINLNTTRRQIVHGLIVRMLDKIIRFAHLELLGEPDKVGEQSSETSGDSGVYGFMASAVTGKVKKCQNIKH